MTDCDTALMIRIGIFFFVFFGVFFLITVQMQMNSQRRSRYIFNFCESNVSVQIIRYG